MNIIEKKNLYNNCMFIDSKFMCQNFGKNMTFCLDEMCHLYQYF